MMKRWMPLLLALCLLLSLTACGGEDGGILGLGGGSGSADGLALTDDVLMSSADVTLGTPSTTLDPQQIYADLTYTPEMFQGHYRLLGGDSAPKTLAQEQDTMELTFGGEERVLTVLPHKFEAGDSNLMHWITRITDRDWCRVYYMRQYGDNSFNLDSFLCAYTVEGNTLTLNPVDTFEVDTENNHITYAMSDVFLTYEFSFKGRELTLTKDGASITLNAGLTVYEDEVHLNAEAYLSGDLDLEGIKEILLGYYGVDSHVARVYLLDGSQIYCCAKMESNGLLTLTIPWETDTKTYQFVYFYCGDDGLVLTDGTNTYYYNHSWDTYMRGDLSVNVTDENAAILEELPEEKLEEIVEKKDDLMADLTAAFADAGIQVTVNTRTGELAMDASILFGGNSAELTEEGKAFLDQFTAVYASIISNEKYDGFVSKTLVEGHTAKLADSTYESGLPLSQERADMVRDYCANAVPALADDLEAVGMSCSKPIYAADGSVDLAASRRVSFKFIINLLEE